MGYGLPTTAAMVQSQLAMQKSHAATTEDLNKLQNAVNKNDLSALNFDTTAHDDALSRLQAKNTNPTASDSSVGTAGVAPRLIKNPIYEAGEPENNQAKGPGNGWAGDNATEDNKQAIHDLADAVKDLTREVGGLSDALSAENLNVSLQVNQEALTASLEQRIAVLEKQKAALQQGQQGEKGEPGTPGKDGKDNSGALQELQDQISILNKEVEELREGKDLEKDSQLAKQEKGTQANALEGGFPDNQPQRKESEADNKFSPLGSNVEAHDGTLGAEMRAQREANAAKTIQDAVSNDKISFPTGGRGNSQGPRVTNPREPNPITLQQNKLPETDRAIFIANRERGSKSAWPPPTSTTDTKGSAPSSNEKSQGPTIAPNTDPDGNKQKAGGILSVLARTFSLGSKKKPGGSQLKSSNSAPRPPGPGPDR